MALSLTCDCGARFEVEDTLAGQMVACPECQEPIQAPSGQRPPLRTSMLALASVVCAVVGAFTLVGTVAAVVLGFIALVSILRHRDRLAGLGFATFGIVAGLVFTALTLFAFSNVEAFGLNKNWAKAQNLAPFVDVSGPLEINRRAFAITRPSEAWGVFTGGQPKDPLVKALQNNSDLVMVEVTKYAFIDVRVEPMLPTRSLDAYQQQLLLELNPHRDPSSSDDASPISNSVLQSSTNVASKWPGVLEKELVLEVHSGRKTWQMLIHLYKHKGNLYVVRCYTPKNQYDRLQDEFRKALNSFSVTPKG